MEETKKQEAMNNSKPSYEQLEQIAQVLQQKYLQAENNIRAINMTSIRLDYLFKVLDKAQYFSEEFINKCAKEIEDIVDIKEEEIIPEEVN